MKRGALNGPVHSEEPRSAPAYPRVGQIPAPSFEPIEEGSNRYRHLWTVFLLGLIAVGIVGAVAWANYNLGQAPHRLVKALIGSAFVACVLMRPDWCLYVLPVVFAFLDHLPISPLPVLNTTNILVTSLFLGWLGQAVFLRKRLLDPSPWNLPLALFLAWAGFSWLVGAVQEGGGMRNALVLLQEFWGEMNGLVLFYVIFNTVRSWRQIRALAFAFCIGSALGVIPLLTEWAGYGGERRVGGALGQINVAGAYFATAALFTLGLLAAGYPRLRQKAVLLGCLVASTVGMILPASRGAFVGFLAGALPQAARAGAVAVLILLLIAGGFAAWAPAYVKQRVSQTEAAITADGGERYQALNRDAGGRFDFWRASLRIIAAHPILGVGFGRTHLAMEGLVGEARSPHNVYLATAGDMGIPGLLGLLWLFWIALRVAGSLTRSPGFPRGLGLAYRGAIFGLMVANLFGGRIFCLNLGGAFAFLTALVFRARSLLDEGVPDRA